MFGPNLPAVAARTCCLVGMVVALPSSASLSGAEPWPSVGVGTSPAAERIVKALDEPTQFNFVDMPLDEVFGFIEKMHEVQVHMDESRLEEEGISTDTLINLELRDITFRSALRLLLRDCGLSYVITDEVLFVTTPAEAARIGEVRLYNVAPLVGEQNDVQQIVGLLELALWQGEGLHHHTSQRASLHRRRQGVATARDRVVEPSRSRAPVGRFSVFGNVIVVRAPEADQRRVGEFLRSLNEARRFFDDEEKR